GSMGEWENGSSSSTPTPPLSHSPIPFQPDSSPRFCSSYFALYGDPLLDPDLDPYPEGYLARLAAAGVNGIWLQATLSRLSPFPWDMRLSAQCEKRRRNLCALIERARRHGVGVYLYLNEPRARPLAFFDSHPELRGVVEQTADEGRRTEDDEAGSSVLRPS